MTDAVPVPSAVADQARRALAERQRVAGIPGASRQAIVCALELAQSPFVPDDTLRLVGAWHAANPNATTADGRCTRLAGLYGGVHGRKWATDYDAVPTVSWLHEESATLEAFETPVTAAVGPKAAGVALVARDTGRVLMLQRCMDETDPASGKWEFPGGTLDDGETPLDAARREFAEETGLACPGGLFGAWTSPNGIYRLFCYTTPTEADVAINVDHEDRHHTNPDDPDGDLIETLAWWTPADVDGMPALRDEAEWTPWDELGAIADQEAQTAALLTETQARNAAYTDLATRAQKARNRLKERTQAAASVAMRDAMRRAGVKVVQRASRRSNSAKAAVAASSGRWTPAVLAAVGVTEADLIKQAFDSLGDRYQTWVIQAATDQLKAVADMLGLDQATVIARMQTRMGDVARAASTRLNDDLTQWAYRLLQEPEPSFGDVGEIPVDPTLPQSVLTPSLMLADGRKVASDGDPGGEGLLLEAWLKFDADAPVEVITWTCGEPVRPFPPHQDLCGTTSQWADYTGTFGSEVASFPAGESYWFPGDHAGCQCDYDYSYISAVEAGLV